MTVYGRLESVAAGPACERGGPKKRAARERNLGDTLRRIVAEVQAIQAGNNGRALKAAGSTQAVAGASGVAARVGEVLPVRGKRWLRSS